MDLIDFGKEKLKLTLPSTKTIIWDLLRSTFIVLVKKNAYEVGEIKKKNYDKYFDDKYNLSLIHI